MVDRSVNACANRLLSSFGKVFHHSEELEEVGITNLDQSKKDRILTSWAVLISETARRSVMELIKSGAKPDDRIKMLLEVKKE